MEGILFIDAEDWGLKGMCIATSQTIGSVFIEAIIGKIVHRHKLIKQPSALILVMSELSLDNRCIASYFTIIACIRRILMLIRPEIVNVANIGQQIMSGRRTIDLFLARPTHHILL